MRNVLFSFWILFFASLAVAQGTNPYSNYVTVKSKTGNYTILASDDVVECSGAPLTFTLPLATARGRRPLVVRKTDATLSNTCSIARAGSDTIRGSASNYVLVTLNESVTLLPKASDWTVLNHFASTGWIDGGAISLSSSGGSVVKGATVIDKLWYRRDGPDFVGRIEYRQSGAGTAGSGDYLITLPVTIDTNFVTAYSTIGGTPSQFTNRVGGGSWSAGTPGDFSVVVYDSTKIRFFSDPDNAFVSGATRPTSNTTQGYKADFRVPVSGWEP
jgi:hypothetical protein